MLEDILRPTHGIMVYQEQIMQTAQIMGGYSLGRADVLRRAMGKKKLEVMKAEQQEFVAGAVKQGIDEKKAIETFEIMEKLLNMDLIVPILRLLTCSISNSLS